MIIASLATKVTDPAAENAALATQPIASARNVFARTTNNACHRMPLSQNAALPWNQHADRRLARRHGERAVLKKGPFRANLSRARQAL